MIPNSSSGWLLLSRRHCNASCDKQNFWKKLWPIKYFWPKIITSSQNSRSNYRLWRCHFHGFSASHFDMNRFRLEPDWTLGICCCCCFSAMVDTAGIYPTPDLVFLLWVKISKLKGMTYYIVTTLFKIFFLTHFTRSCCYQSRWNTVWSKRSSLFLLVLGSVQVSNLISFHHPNTESEEDRASLNPIVYDQTCDLTVCVFS